MKKDILSKAIVNKVNYNDETYLRVYNIDESGRNKGSLINLRLFHEVNPHVYMPFFYEKGVDENLYNRLMTTDINEDIIISTEDIKLFLMSLNLYIENTYDVVKSSVESMMPNYEMIIYKEYMGIFYVVMSSEQDARIFEVKIDKNGKISLLTLEDNMVNILICRDFCRYISEDIEMYIKVSDKRYMVITNVSGKQCFMDIKISNDNSYNLKSIKFADGTDEDISLSLDIIKDKFKYILEIENKNNLNNSSDSSEIKNDEVK